MQFAAILLTTNDDGSTAARLGQMDEPTAAGDFPVRRDEVFSAAPEVLVGTLRGRLVVDCNR